MKITVINRFPDWNLLSYDIERYYNIYRTSTVIVHDILKNNIVPKHPSTLTIKYAFTGNEYYKTDRCRYRVSPDNFLVLNNGQSYESFIDSGHNVESLSVFFEPSLVSEVYCSMISKEEKMLESFEALTNGNFDFKFTGKLFAKDNLIVPALNRMRIYINSGASDRNSLSEQINFLIRGLFAIYKDQYKEISLLPYRRKSTKEELFKRLYNVKDFISSAYNENITLSKLAVVACMNKHYLLREFKRNFKQTPYQYLTSVRLMEAKKLLENTGKSISEISELTGFEFVSSFTHLFVEHFRIPPGRYRNFISRKKSTLNKKIHG